MLPVSHFLHADALLSMVSLTLLFLTAASVKYFGNVAEERLDLKAAASLSHCNQKGGLNVRQPALTTLTRVSQYLLSFLASSAPGIMR